MVRDTRRVRFRETNVLARRDYMINSRRLAASALHKTRRDRTRRDIFISRFCDSTLSRDHAISRDYIGSRLPMTPTHETTLRYFVVLFFPFFFLALCFFCCFFFQYIYIFFLLLFVSSLKSARLSSIGLQHCSGHRRNSRGIGRGWVHCWSTHAQALRTAAVCAARFDSSALERLLSPRLIFAD